MSIKIILPAFSDLPIRNYKIKDMFSAIATIMAPVFICVTIGFLWARSGRSYDLGLITNIVTYIGTPCLIFYSLSTVEIHPKTLVDIGLAALLSLGAFLVLGSSILAMFGLDQRAFLLPIIFPNVGNIGLPVCYLAFGQEGMALAITVFSVYVIFCMTIGVGIVSGSFAPKAILKMPIIPATLLAVFFLAAGIKTPEWLYNTTKLIGDLTIPLMLITLGVSLSQLKVVRLKTAVFLSLIRLIIGFGVGYTIVSLMNLTGAAAGVVILQCSMPVAVFCYLFAQMYNQKPEEVAGVVIISTVLGFSILPAILWYVL